MDKELLIGTGAGVLAIAGIYLAVKQQSANGGPVAPAAIYSIAPGSISGTANTSSVNPSPTASDMQIGDLTTALNNQTIVAQTQADNSFRINMLAAANQGADQVLARGVDLQGRDAGTLNLAFDTAQTIDSASGSPIHTAMSGHLIESVPGLPPPPPPPPPPPAPIFITPAPAPAPIIQSGGGCFITTAVCLYFNLPDDCEALTTLRSLRDNFMMKYEPYRSMVIEYYENAPRIVEKLSKFDVCTKGNCYHDFYTAFIMPSVLLIKAGRYEEAVAKYEELYRYAMDLTGLQCPPHSLQH